MTVLHLGDNALLTELSAALFAAAGAQPQLRLLDAAGNTGLGSAAVARVVCAPFPACPPAGGGARCCIAVRDA